MKTIAEICKEFGVYETPHNRAAIKAFVQHGMTLAAEMVRRQGIHSDFALSHPGAEQFMSDKILRARDNFQLP